MTFNRHLSSLSCSGFAWRFSALNSQFSRFSVPQVYACVLPCASSKPSIALHTQPPHPNTPKHPRSSPSKTEYAQAPVKLVIEGPELFEQGLGRIAAEVLGTVRGWPGILLVQTSRLDRPSAHPANKALTIELPRSFHGPGFEAVGLHRVSPKT